MKIEELSIAGIPALIWGETSDKVYLYVHGKLSCKEYAADFAKAAVTKGCQTISFDLPEHGARKGKAEICDIWQGMKDLEIISDYVFTRWRHVNLFACSLGAYFALNTYGEKSFQKCLLQSPILDMEWLIHQMMAWAGVNAEDLKRKKEIPTAIDTLKWDYYQYVLAHPVKAWPFPTEILYGGKDNLQPLECIEKFARDFSANITVSQNSEHPFMGKEDLQIVKSWLEKVI